MDIYSAEIQVNKLLNYVNGLSDAKPRMYQKSKDRLKELANTCKEVIVVISEILQDEALVTDNSDEFGGSDIRAFNSMLNCMEDQISELRLFLNSPRAESVNLSETDDSSKSAKKTAFSDYKTCLNSLAHSNIQVAEADECSKLLWRWFSARFMDHAAGFRYTMKKVPQWLRNIVVLYCYHLESGDLMSFVTMFYNWISAIDFSSNYAVPYEVYQLDKFCDPNKMTLTAVVMWDILLDYGLRDLCKTSDLYLTEDAVYTLVGALNSSIMDPYTNYTYDQSILSRCNLTVKAGDSV